MLLRPRLDRLEVIIFGQLGEGLAPIMSDRAGFFPDIFKETGEVRSEVVAAPALKFFEEIGRPIGARHFQTIAEHRVRRVFAQRVQERFTDHPQVLLDGFASVVIEHQSPRAVSRRRVLGPRGTRNQKFRLG